MYFLSCLTLFPAPFPLISSLAFFLYYHIFCAHQGRSAACFRNIDSFQSLGKFGTERACSLYQQIR